MEFGLKIAKTVPSLDCISPKVVSLFALSRSLSSIFAGTYLVSLSPSGLGLSSSLLKYSSRSFIYFLIFNSSNSFPMASNGLFGAVGVFGVFGSASGTVAFAVLLSASFTRGIELTVSSGFFATNTVPS